MASYAKPLYSVQEVNAAGRRLRDFLNGTEDPLNLSGETNQAFEVIDNFRATHAFPLNTFLMTLRNRAFHVSTESITAQRIKRLVSIVVKLGESPDMKLSQMQDIGGCRAIVPNLTDLWELRAIYEQRPLSHNYNGEKDYIYNPKSTGYRGIHLKYRFVGSGISAPWSGLKIEVQLRTLLQHKWATAVEAAGTFTEKALKSNKGPLEWLRLFSLMGSVFALREECPTVPGTPETMDDLVREIQVLDREYALCDTFEQYHTIIPQIAKTKGAGYFLVILDPEKRQVRIQGFNRRDSQLANRRYTQAETLLSKSKSNVVLVSVSSISALKRAYPNYFLDTAEFLREMRGLVSSAVN